MSVRDRIYGATWRKVRKQILARDGYVCQIRGPRCEGLARDVDHIIRPDDGGAWFDPDNLRAACRKCNRGRPLAGVRRHPSRQW